MASTFDLSAVGKTPLIADVGAVALGLEHLLELLVDLGAPPQSFCEIRCPTGATMNS